MPKLEDIKIWCENNRGTCAGLIFVLLLLILIISTGKSCDFSINSEESSSTIQKMIFIDDDGDSGTDHTRKHRSFVEVVPLTRYRLRFEVLLNDLGGADEKVSDIKFNEISLGECNPLCDGMTERECDYACLFYDCSSQLQDTVVTSGTSTLTFELKFQGISRDCDCNKNTGECKKEDLDGNLRPVMAAAKITLTPIT